MLLALLIALTGAGDVIGQVEEAIILPDCDYSLVITQNPENEKEFRIWAPDEIITTARAESIVGGNLEIFSDRHLKLEAEIFLGPFEWQLVDGGYNLTIVFKDTPSFVAAAIVAWEKNLRTGCGFWVKPGVYNKEVFLPIIQK